MRIIGGKFGGRVLKAAAGRTTRPTASRVREGIASALEARAAFSGATVLDLFAGTGAMALEAISRGAASAICVDADGSALRALEENIAALDVGSAVRTLRLDLLRDVKRAAAAIAAASVAPFDLVFADPPYRLSGDIDGLIRALIAEGALRRGAWLVVEFSRKGSAPNCADGAVECVATYRHGDTCIWLGHTV